MLVTVYCSGSIQKGPSDIKRAYWTDIEREAVAKSALPLEVRFLNPDDPIETLSDNMAAFGRDMYQVQIADFVIVDARERRGLGIGVEMLTSRIVGTPLIVVAPRNTTYRQDSLLLRGSTVSNYVHFHVACLADAIVDDFSAAGSWIKEYMSAPNKPKDISAVSNAINRYKTDLLPVDKPMLEVLNELKAAGKSIKEHIEL